MPIYHGHASSPLILQVDKIEPEAEAVLKRIGATIRKTENWQIPYFIFFPKSSNVNLKLGEDKGEGGASWTFEIGEEKFSINDAPHRQMTTWHSRTLYLQRRNT